MADDYAAADRLRRALAAFDAASFVRRHGGYKESLSSLSSEYLLTCPCGSSRLRWNARSHVWVCWGHPPGATGRSGDTVQLICLLEGVDEIDAIDLVMAGYVGGDARFETLAGELRERTRQLVRLLPSVPWPQGVDRLTEPCAPHRQAWDYLLGRRGLTQEQVREYGLGYGRSGKLHGYVVFPVQMDRSLVFWQGRCTWDPPIDLTPDVRREWVARMGYKKTLNPVTAGANATASEVLFNYDRASTAEQVVVVEGPVDAVKVGPHAVALFGKVAHPPKVERLKRMSARSFVVYLDRGEEERKSALALAKELAPYADVRIVQPPEGHDPGSLSPAQNARVVGEALPFRTDQLTSKIIQ